MHQNFDCSRKPQVVRRSITNSELQLPDTNTSSCIPIGKPNVADLQDFGSLDKKETPLRGRKEEQNLGQGSLTQILKRSLTQNKQKILDLRIESQRRLGRVFMVRYQTNIHIVLVTRDSSSSKLEIRLMTSFFCRSTRQEHIFKQRRQMNMTKRSSMSDNTGK